LKRVALALLLALLLVAAAGLGFYVAVGTPAPGSGAYVVASRGMEPALRPGEHFVSDAGKSAAVGSIVVVSDPDGVVRPSRVIALGGQTVDLRGGAVYVDGARLDEPYASDPTHPFGATVVYPANVPQGDVWVMGDNRARSADSRSFGPVAGGSIKGVVTHVYWPPFAFRSIGAK
jgi:signal peptidase I